MLLNVDHTVEIITECSKLSLWLSVNCLVLNISKCNYVHFSLKHQVITFPHVHLNNNTVNNTKFHGCFIDSTLNWQTHIENEALKMGKGIAMVRAVYNVPVYIKHMIHFTYIYPYMIYCLPAWGATVFLCYQNNTVTKASNQTSLWCISSVSYYAIS